MLREIRNVKEIPGQGVRRWFNDERLDLFVWYDAAGRVLGFQLCFDKHTHAERALTFTETGGYTLDHVTAETSVCDLGSPVLLRAGEFCRRQLLAQLDERGAFLERSLYDYLVAKLEACDEPMLRDEEETMK